VTVRGWKTKSECEMTPMRDVGVNRAHVVWLREKSHVRPTLRVVMLVSGVTEQSEQDLYELYHTVQSLKKVALALER
jgi:hypothetical protein